LDHLLVSSGDEQTKRAALFMLFSTFPAGQVSDEMARAKVAGYLFAVREFPSWAVQRAVEKWIGGEVEPGARFAASAPELVEVAKGVVQSVSAERDSLTRLLNAKTKDLLPPPPADSPAKAKAIQQMLKPSPTYRRDSRGMSEAEAALIRTAAKIGVENITQEMIEEAERLS
jgi:hypothetical protein